MGALTRDRATVERSGNTITLPAAAGKKFFAGALAARDASGNATPGATATNLRGVGRVEAYVDNSNGVAGSEGVDIRKGIFKYANSADDTITAADIDNDCYMVDDQTVAKTSGTNTRSVAGTVFDVEADGVWVRFN